MRQYSDKRERCRLGLRLDAIAQLREQGRTAQPDPVQAATLAELAGVDAFVCHLRVDRRHIQDRDVRLLRKVSGVDLILQVAPTAEMLSVAMEIKPDLLLFVPEVEGERALEGRAAELDLDLLGVYCRKAVEAGLHTGALIPARVEQVRAARKLGLEVVELHTGRLLEVDGEERRAEFRQIEECLRLCEKIELDAALGHDLGLGEVRELLTIGAREFWLGHSLVARALFLGLERACRDVVDLLRAH
ncbi:MAG: hypothetical protein A2284_07675 [Deltaproteobacteria bacterium RIFOXYA12_FULL_61_11]|nr:MAG: hypothetical protein A2284_07675 [Deltaproteobacteria bacterium RIFOXYA12_FULL_61_11]